MRGVFDVIKTSSRSVRPFNMQFNAFDGCKWGDHEMKVTRGRCTDWPTNRLIQMRNAERISGDYRPNFIGFNCCFVATAGLLQWLADTVFVNRNLFNFAKYQRVYWLQCGSFHYFRSNNWELKFSANIFTQTYIIERIMTNNSRLLKRPWLLIRILERIKCTGNLKKNTR